MNVFADKNIAVRKKIIRFCESSLFTTIGTVHFSIPEKYVLLVPTGVVD
jgi:hypothetical protein